ncbi:hypothetical protein D3C81_1056800 [compost metagenome]
MSRDTAMIFSNSPCSPNIGATVTSHHLGSWCNVGQNASNLADSPSVTFLIASSTTSLDSSGQSCDHATPRTCVRSPMCIRHMPASFMNSMSPRAERIFTQSGLALSTLSEYGSDDCISSPAEMRSTAMEMTLEMPSRNTRSLSMKSSPLLLSASSTPKGADVPRIGTLIARSIPYFFSNDGVLKRCSCPRWFDSTGL